MSLPFPHVRALSDEQLMTQVQGLVEVARRTTANLIVLLMEVEARDLALKEGCSSLFGWCVERLAFSGHKADNYLRAMGWAKRFPAVLAMIAEGKLNLSGLRVIGPHLSDANAAGRLEEAAGRTRRELEELVAKWSPRPDVPGRIRKLPPARPSVAAPRGVKAESPPPTELKLERPTPKRMEPLSETRFKLEVTVDAKLKGKLDEAMALAGHQVKEGDYAGLMELALKAFVAAKMKRFGGRGPKKAKTPKPAAREADPPEAPVNEAGAGHAPMNEPKEATEPKTQPLTRSRAIPAQVKRTVVERDGLRCAYVGPLGRCKEIRRLELHHIEPFALGGAHSVDNISMRCQAHNQMEARAELGAAFVARKIEARGTS